MRFLGQFLLIGLIALTPQAGAQCVPPHITTQPDSYTVCVGDTVTFTVIATGTAMDYMWSHDGVMIPGNNHNQLVIPNVTQADEGVYRVRVDNACGMEWSAPAILTVMDPPVITSGPGALTGCAGGSVTFTVTLGGDGPFTIEWAMPRSGGAYGGPNATSMTLDNLTLADAGPIAVRVNNQACPTVEAFGSIAIEAPPTIVQDPQDVTVCTGAPASFSVTGAGSPPLTYQWSRDGVDILGATNDTYTIPATTLADHGSTFSAAVSNGCGTVTSKTAVLSVAEAPVLTLPPQNQSACTGEPVTFRVEATSLLPMTYEWFDQDGDPIPGANASILDLGPADLSMAGPYTVFVTNQCGATSATATLVVNEGPALVDPPDGGAVCPGGSLTLSAIATGAPPLTYQWYKDGIVLAGETTPTLAISGAGATDEGIYHVVVTNSCGTAASPQVPVLVTEAVRNWTPVSGGMNGPVFALASFDDGTGSALYAGGDFMTAGGVPASGIARWVNDAWQPVGGGMNGAVHALGVFDLGSGPALYAAGQFTTAGGAPINRIAKWSGGVWQPLGTGIPNGTVRALELFDDGAGLRLYAGGTFNLPGGEGIASWDGAAWNPVAGGVMGTVYALEVFDDDAVIAVPTATGPGARLYVGGDFAALPAPASHLVRWGPEGWTSIGAPAPNATVRVLYTYDDGTGPALYVGGDFQDFNGLKGIARWNGSSWSALGEGLSTGPVYTLTSYDDGTGLGLYAGGNFTTSGLMLVNRVARWQNGVWSELTMGRDDLVRALAVHVTNGCADLYAGGFFMSAGGQPALFMARWKAEFTLDLAQPLGPGSLTVTNAFGDPNVNYFSAFSFDPANATSPGAGNWFGMFISTDDVLAQFYSGTPPFVGVLDPTGISFFMLPPGTLSGGATAWGVTVMYDPILLSPGGFTPVDSITLQ